MSNLIREQIKVLANFASDNTAGIHPDILKAITSCNEGSIEAYGNDFYTKEADKKFQEHFGQSAEAFFVFNGTAANVIGLRGLTESFHSIICADTAHINVSECNAVEKFTGCKLLPITSEDGKITIEQIQKHMYGIGEQHHAQPKVISITQPTEMGIVYKPLEIKELADFAHMHNMHLHMDGARLANAAVNLNCELRETTNDVGVDVLSFGGTKNGIMHGEAVVFFDRDLSKNFKFVRKQGMQLASKMRFISVQFTALLSNDLWRKNAIHANEMAKYLESKLKEIPRIKLTQKVETNTVFAIINSAHLQEIYKKYFFYIWNEETSEVRLMTSFNTKKEEIDDFMSYLKKAIN